MTSNTDIVKGISSRSKKVLFIGITITETLASTPDDHISRRMRKYWRKFKGGSQNDPRGGNKLYN